MALRMALWLYGGTNRGWMEKGAQHGRAGTAEGRDGRAPVLGERLQRRCRARDPAWVGGRSRRGAAATEVHPRRGRGLHPPHGRRQSGRSPRHPGTPVRRADGRDCRASGTVGQHRARAPLVSIRELGTLGGAISQAKAVNGVGHVVGTSRDALGRSRAFRWEEGVGIADLGPSIGVHSSANDINERGEIVGGGDTGFGDFHAFFLSEGLSFDLGTLGGNESEALALNRLGQVAGHSRIRDSVTRHAFFVPEPGKMIDLGSLGRAMSVAHDVNERGEVVGLAETRAGQPHAFLWTAPEGMRDLGTLGETVSMALGINDRTEVVGGSGRAFLWTEHAGIVDLGTLGGRTSCANDVNDDGYIVGVSQTGAADGRGRPITHAFVRTPDGHMLDLGTLGGEHSSAAKVSGERDGALWIAGHSHDASARVRAVLWAVHLA